MMILDVQAVVRQPREESMAQNTLEPRSQTSIEKRNSFAYQLKKLSSKKAVSSSDLSKENDISTKTNAEDSQNLQQATELFESSEGEANNQVPVQEKQIISTQAEETCTSSDSKQPLVASGEIDPSLETDAQLQNNDEAAQMNTVIAVQLPQAAQLSEVIIDMTSTATPDELAISLEPALASKTVNQGQGREESVYPTAMILTETLQPQGAEAGASTQGKVSSPITGNEEQVQGQETKKTSLVSEGLMEEVQVRSMEAAVPPQLTVSTKEEIVPLSSESSPPEEADQLKSAASTVEEADLSHMEDSSTEKADPPKLAASTMEETVPLSLDSSSPEEVDQPKLTVSTTEKTVPLSLASFPPNEEGLPKLASSTGEADLLRMESSPTQEADLPKLVTSPIEAADLPKLTNYPGGKTATTLVSDSMPAELNPQVIQAVPGAEDSTAEVVFSSPITAVSSNQADNTQTVVDDGQETVKELNSLVEAEASISTESETNTNKKDSKAQNKSRMNMRLMEEPLLGQSVKKNEDQANTNVKKIIDFESQRLTKKVPTKLIVQDETMVNKSGDTQLQSLTTLDKNLIEPAKPGLESGKTLLQSTTEYASDAQDIVDQIVKKVELLNKVVGSEMKIQLKPEFLGKMIIDIAVNDGVVTARFTTENQHVKQVLEANMNSLKQTLEANGMKVERTEVNVQLDNGGNFNGSEGNRQQLWQDMAGQGRSTTSYSQFNSWELSEVEEETPYQWEANATRTVNEGRVDFVV